MSSQDVKSEGRLNSRSEAMKRRNAAAWGDATGRFHQLYDRDPESGHAIWKETSPRDNKGRPIFRTRNRTVSARHWFYEEELKVTLRKGDCLQPECGCEDCVEPTHMKLISRSETSKRVMQQRWGDPQVRLQKTVSIDGENGCQVAKKQIVINGETINRRRYEFEQKHHTTLSEEEFLYPICQNRRCVNPAHMVRMTRSEMARRINHVRWNVPLAPLLPPAAPETPGEMPVRAAFDFFFLVNPKYALVSRSQAAGHAGAYWKSDPEAGKRSFHVPEEALLFVQIGLTEEERAEGARVELLERLTDAQDADGVYALLYILRLLTPPGPIPSDVTPAAWISLNDVIEKIGWKPRSSEERKRMRERIWGYLRFGARVGVYGKRPSVYQEEATGKQIATEIDGPIWSLQDRERPIQPSLLETYEVPLRVRIALSETWAKILTDPRMTRILPVAERLGQIACNQPGGAWARCIALAQVQFWLEQPELALEGKLFLTRRQLLTLYIPKSSPPMEVLTGKDPAHARIIWRSALRFLAPWWIEPNEETPRDAPDWQPKGSRQGWQEEWLEEKVLQNPGSVIRPFIQQAAYDQRPISRPLYIGEKGRGRPSRSQ